MSQQRNQKSNKNEVVKYFTLELLNLSQLQEIKSQNYAQNHISLEKFINLYLNISDTNNNLQIYTRYKLQDESIPLRILQGDELIHHFHIRDKADIAQLVFFNSEDDIHNLSSDFISYISSRLVSPLISILILNESEKSHGQEINSNFQKTHQFFQKFNQKFQFIYFNINNSQKIQVVEEVIKNALQKMYKTKKSTQENFLKQQNEKIEHNLVLDKWTQQDILNNMSFLSNSVRKLGEKDLKIYYGLSDKEVITLELKKKAKKYEEELKLIIPKEIPQRFCTQKYEDLQLKKNNNSSQNQENEEENKLNFREQDIQQEDKIYLKKVAYDQVLVANDQIYQFLSLQFGRKFPNHLLKIFQNYVTDYKLKVSQILEEVKLRNTRQKKNEEIYSISLTQNSNFQPPPQIQNTISALELTDIDATTAKCIALGQILSPMDKLQVYVKLLYGQPIDGIMVNKMMNSIEKYNLKFLEQLKQIKQEQMNLRKINKSYKAQQMGSLEVLDKEQLRKYILEIQKSTQDTMDEYADFSICQDYLKETMKQFMQAKGRQYLEMEDFKSITTENIILTIQSDKKSSLNLKLGYPPKDILEQIIKNMETFLENKIQIWKHLYGKYIADIKLQESKLFQETSQIQSFELTDDDLITVKTLAFQNILQPIQQLRNYVYVLYGRPKDVIVVNTIMEQIEKFNLQFIESLKSIQQDNMNLRMIKKQQKAQQMGSLEVLDKEQIQKYIFEQKKSTQDKMDEYAYLSICKEYLKETMKQFMQNKGRSYLELQDFKNITTENIIASIKSDKKSSLNLKLGYPPKDILEQIVKNMETFLESNIQIWKNLYSLYNAELKKNKRTQKYLQNGLSLQESELIYFEFGKLFVGGFKLVRLKMFSSKMDEYSLSLCKSLMRINSLKVFTQTQFRTYLEYESFETLFKKGDSPSVLVDDPSNFFISFVNMSQKESTEQFLKFTKNQFILKRNLSHIIVFILDGEKKQKEHDEILKWQDNLSSKVKKIWINKNILHNLNVIRLIKEKMEEVVVDRVKDQGFIKFALFDQFSDFDNFKQKINYQYEHPNKSDIENSFIEYIDSKCFNEQKFDRSYLIEIFKSWLEPNLFDSLQIKDIVQILIHEDNYLMKQISGNLDGQIKIISLQINTHKEEEQQNIDENDHFQLVIYVQEQFYQSQFKKINDQNQIQWKEAFYVKAAEEDEVLIQMISYKEKKVWFQNRISFKYILKSTEIELISVDDDQKFVQINMANQIINFYKEKSQQDSLPLREFVKRKFELYKLIIPQKEVQKIDDVNQFAEYLKQNNQLNKNHQTDTPKNQANDKEQSSKVNELKILKELQQKIANFLEQIKKYKLENFNCDLIENSTSINGLAKKIDKNKGEIQKTEKQQTQWIDAQQYKQFLIDYLSSMQKTNLQKRVVQTKEKLEEINRFKSEELKLKDKILIQREKKKKKDEELEEIVNLQKKGIEDIEKRNKKAETIKQEIQKNSDDILSKLEKCKIKLTEIEEVKKKIEEWEKQKEEKIKQKANEIKSAHPHTNIRKQSAKEEKSQRDITVNQKEQEFNFQDNNNNNKEQIDQNQKETIQNKVDQERNKELQIFQALNNQKNDLEEQASILKFEINQLKKQNEQHESILEKMNEKNQIATDEEQDKKQIELKQEIEKIENKIKSIEVKIEQLPGYKQYYDLIEEQKEYVLSNKIERKKDDKDMLKIDNIIRQTIEDIDELVRQLNQAKKNLEEKQKKNDEQIAELEKQINNLGNKWIQLQKQIMFKKQQDYLGQTKLNEAQKKKMSDYMVEFERNLTLHFTKTYTMLNDVFQVKTSNTEVILEKLGDLLPIPFFKSVMTIISGAYKIVSNISNNVKKRQLEMYSELFPTSEVQQQVAKGVLKQIIIKRQFERGYFTNLMNGLEEKFADNDICEKIDNGAKQMALIDATAFIGITLRWFSDLQSPPNIDLNDYYNMSWKQKLITDKLLQLPVDKLFFNVKGLKMNDTMLKAYEETQIGTNPTEVTSSQNQNGYTNKGNRVYPSDQKGNNPKKSFINSLFSCLKKK